MWGGWNGDVMVPDGAAYNPVSNAWRELPQSPVGASPSDTLAVWTGREMVVVGAVGDLAAYSPSQNQWTRLPDPPSGKVFSPTFLRAGSEVIVWGGASTSNPGFSNDGAILHMRP